MTIHVKLFATLRFGREKEYFLSLPDPIKKEDILEELDIAEEEVAIFYVNGRKIKKNQIITNKDIISLFPPVGGG